MKRSIIKLMVCCLLVFGFTSCDDDDNYIPPELSKMEVEIETFQSAYVSWNITFDKYEESVENGLCWSLSENPTIEDHFIVNEKRAGDIIMKLDDLPSNEEIFVRAYSKTGKGIFYSEEKNFTLWLGVAGDPVEDVDGNVYKTVRIGNQIWLQENLKTTRFRNGETIPEVTKEKDSEWMSAESAMYCRYNDSEKLGDYYGFLYNSFVITGDRMIAPEGYQVPSNQDWSVLFRYLGGGQKAAEYLLMTEVFVTGTGVDENTLPAKHLYNFGGLASGVRWKLSDEWTSTEYDEINKKAFWWKGNGYSAVGVGRGEDYTSNYQMHETTGLSIRCVKNIE